MTIREHRMRIIFLLQQAGLSKAEAESEVIRKIVSIAAGYVRRRETPEQASRVILCQPRIKSALRQRGA